MKTNRRLRHLLEQERMERYFNSHIREFFPEAKKITDLKIEEHHTFSPSTTAIRYTLEMETPRGRKIIRRVRGSVSIKDEYIENRAKAARIMTILHTSKEFKGNLTLPRPLIFDRELGLLLYLEVPGMTLRNFLCSHSKSQNHIKFIKKTAEWLANFHNFPKILKEKQTKKFIETKIALFKKTFADYYQVHYKEIKVLLDLILKEQLSIYNRDLFTPVHGDFTPSNIIIQRRHDLLAVVDFIDSMTADPAYDVAVFLVQLEELTIWKYIKEDYGKKIKNIFIDTYKKQARIDTDNWTQRVNAYQAFNTMQVAKAMINVIPHEITDKGWVLRKLFEYAEKCIKRSRGKKIIT